MAGTAVHWSRKSKVEAREKQATKGVPGREGKQKKGGKVRAAWHGGMPIHVLKLCRQCKRAAWGAPHATVRSIALLELGSAEQAAHTTSFLRM